MARGGVQMKAEHTEGEPPRGTAASWWEQTTQGVQEPRPLRTLAQSLNSVTCFLTLG